MKRLLGFLAVCGIVSVASAAYTTTGLAFHLDASTLTGYSNGDTVSTWADTSGFGNVATSAGTPTYVAGALNGKAAVSITGSLTLDGYSWTGQETDFYNLASTVHNIKTVAMVFKRTSNNYYGGAVPLFGSGPTGWVNEAFNGDSSYGTAYWGNGADPAVRYSDVRINGVSIGAGNAEYTSVLTDYHIMVMTIQNGWGSDINIDQIAASSDNNGHVYGMDVAELLVYDTFLSGSDLADVETYLNNKYFVPEPATMALLGLGACLLRRKR